MQLDNHRNRDQDDQNIRYNTQDRSGLEQRRTIDTVGVENSYVPTGFNRTAGKYGAEEDSGIRANIDEDGRPRSPFEPCLLILELPVEEEKNQF